MMRLTRRQTLASAAALCAASPAIAQTAPPSRPERPLFGAKQWRLANGLEVAFIPYSRAPVVTQYLFYAAGGA